MAREIHDTLAQGLTGIITQLQAAEQAAGRPGRAGTAHFDAATRLARESLSEARRSVEALRPEPLETGRLSEALADVAGRWSALHGIPVQVTTTGTARPMPPEAEFALLRTAQEALANVARHAQATRVGVTLSYMEYEVALDVRDDGRGFDLPRPAPRPAPTPARTPAPRPAPLRPTKAGSAWSRCGSGSRAWPGRCRSSRSRASAPASRPAVAAVVAGRPREPPESPPRRSDQAADRRRSPGGQGRAERHVRRATRSSRCSARPPTAPRRSRSPQALEPDVILMDLRMPGMDGLTAITELARRGVPARVLVLTTYDTDSYVLPAIEAGATGYLLKDAPRAELLRAVRAAAAGPGGAVARRWPPA